MNFSNTHIIYKPVMNTDSFIVYVNKTTLARPLVKMVHRLMCSAP